MPLLQFAVHHNGERTNEVERVTLAKAIVRRREFPEYRRVREPDSRIVRTMQSAPELRAVLVRSKEN